MKKIKKQSQEEKQIPRKNYIEVIIMFLASFALVLLIFYWFNSYKDFQKNIPVIRGTISEIEINDIDNYLLENQDFLLYIGIASNKNCRELENDLKDVLKRRNLINSTIYLNLTDNDNNDKFFADFNKEYSPNKKVNKYPAFIIFRDGKVLDFVQKEKQDLTIANVEELLDVYEVKER